MFVIVVTPTLLFAVTLLVVVVTCMSVFVLTMVVVCMSASLLTVVVIRVLPSLLTVVVVRMLILFDLDFGRRQERAHQRRTHEQATVRGPPDNTDLRGIDGQVLSKVSPSELHEDVIKPV